MIRSFYVILSCFLIQFSVTTRFLSAQSGWGPDQRLVFMQGGGWYPRVACCGDTIHLVWWQAYIGHDEVFYKRSTDAGETWGLDVGLSVEDDKTSVSPWIAVYENNVHVVWQQVDVGICYRRSTDGGNSWLSIDTLPGGSGNPSVCAVGNNVYAVAYRSDGKIVFFRSTDNGNTWLPSQEIGFYCATRPRIKNLKTSQTILIIACQDLSNCIEIYYKKSINEGVTWSESICISHYDSIHSQIPALAIDDTAGIHISWYDYKYSPYSWTGDILYRASRDSGNTWEDIDSLTIVHRARHSDILVEGNNLHLVWEDDRNGFNSNFEIYYRPSTDLGRTWGPELRLTDALYHSYCPSLACSGEYLHLFWQDRREYGNNGSSAPLYYKRKDLLFAITEGRDLPLTSMLKFDVYPNPFSQEIQIGCRMQDSQYKMKDISIRLFDASGKEVRAYEVKDKTIVKIDAKDLPCGVYFVGVEAGNEYMVKKIIKIK